MIGTYFYNGTIKKMIYAFGTMFNNIRIMSNEMEYKIPIHYAPKDKFRQRYLSQRGQNPTTAEVQVSAPRLAFEYGTITYDPSRKLNTMQDIVMDMPGQDKIYRQYMRVPYNIAFNLYLFVGQAEDGLEVVEQIVPYFTPELNITVNTSQVIEDDVLIDKIPHDMSLSLDDFSFEDNWPDDMDSRRRIEWTFNFTARTYLYGIRKDQGIITQSIVNTKDLDMFDPDNPTEYGLEITATPLVPLVPENEGDTPGEKDKENNVKVSVEWVPTQ